MNVLIVDDSSAIHAIIRRVVKQAGLAVTKFLAAGDGSEALEVLKRGEPVGLMFIDVNMPKMNGVGLVSHLKQDSRYTQWKNVPIFMLSMDGTQESVDHALRLGATGFIRKPFTAEQIREKLVEARIIN